MPINLASDPSLSPNVLAMPHVEELIEDAAKLRVKATKIQGVTVIDCGIDVPGSWEAGLVFARATLGGLAQVNLHWADFDGLNWPAVEVITEHPLRACMASQYAGWFVKKDKYSAMGSGPARGILAAEDIYQTIGCRDLAEQAVLCLETGKIPPPDSVDWLKEKLALKAENIYILVAPTASPVGSVQIAARSVETGLHKLMELGYDLGLVERGLGIAPLPPVAANDLEALGRTNDAILYGTTVQYQLRDADEQLAELVHKVPSASSRDFGLPFGQIFARYGNFYDIDPLLFSPAKVWLNNLQSGVSYTAGKIRADILKESFQIKG